MTGLIISADDYALNENVDAGILALITQGRLTAASCLTLSPRWPNAARLLTPEIRGKADIGLHLDFTEYAQPAHHSLSGLIARSLCRSLSSKAIRDAINSQLDRFEDALATAPDYVDGHQHVHQLPQIRDALLDILTQRYVNRLPWLRISRPPVTEGLKALVLNLLGANVLRRKACTMSFRCTDVLLGVYGFDGGIEDYRQKLTSWLDAAQDVPDNICALMCHPALPIKPDNQPDDSIHDARLREYQVLASEEFTDLLTTSCIYAVRGSAALRT